MSGLLLDLRSALRRLRRRQTIALLAVATLALGIGANTAIFTVTRGVLLRPLPYDDPDRLAMVWRAPRHTLSQPQVLRDNPRAVRGIATGNMVRNWRDANSSLVDLAALELWQGNLSSQIDLISADGAERLRGGLATPNFFALLGVQPALGRTFRDDDQDVVILSDGLWRRRFGADPAVIGQRVNLAGGRRREPRPFTIVGVLPSRFRFTYPEDTELWTMLPWRDVNSPSARALSYWVVTRLKGDVTLEQAQADLGRIAESQGDQAHIPSERRDTAWLEPMHEYAVGRVRPALNILAGVTAVVLVIACLSVANLLIAQTAGRRREIALQRAIGASRARVARQVLTESGLMAVIAAVLAVCAVAALQPIIRTFLPASTPRADEIGIDLATIAWATIVAAFAVMVAGLTPAWRVTAIDPSVTAISTHGASGPASVRLRQSLIAAQVALVSVLLIGGGLLLHSFWKLQQVDLGFDGRHVVTAEMRLLARRYSDAAQRRSFQEQLLQRARALPGVTHASITSAVPFRGVDFLRVFDRPNGPGTVLSNDRSVDPDYFEVMRIPLLAGRLFSPADGPSSAPVVVVSESFARMMFPDGNALGQLLELRERPTQVIGIVGDVRAKRIEEAGTPANYTPRAQEPVELMCLVLKTETDPDATMAQIRGLVRSIDPDQPVHGITTIDQIVSESIADRRFYAVATMAFAIVTLLLAAAGICGVLAQAVTERTRELGIRSAVGAAPRDQIATVMRQGMLPIAGGLVLGAIGALWATRLLQQFLFQVGAVDPVAYVATAFSVAAIGALACYIPARRAAHLDPMTALRSE